MSVAPDGQVFRPPAADVAHGSGSASSARHETLREWLSSGSFDVLFAPMVDGSLMLASLVDSLESLGLANISSAGGCSVGGLMAALWSHKQSPSTSGLARIYGRPLPADHCERHACDRETRAYVRLLDDPMLAESRAFAGMYPSEVLERSSNDVLRPGLAEPTREESEIQYLSVLHLLDSLAIPRSFSELPRPVAVTAHDQDRDTQLVFDRGDLWISVLASTAMPGISKPLRVGGGYRAVDGYFGDDHGVRGYDELTSRSGRLLNVIPVDFMGQVPVMDWAKLRDPPGSAVTIFVGLGSLLPTVLGSVMEQYHLPFLTNRVILEALRGGFSSILDAPLRVDKSFNDTSSTSSFSAIIDIPAYLPARDREWSFGRAVEATGEWVIDRMRTTIARGGRQQSEGLMVASNDPHAFKTLAAEDEDGVVESLRLKLREFQRRYLHEFAPDTH